MALYSFHYCILFLILSPLPSECLLSLTSSYLQATKNISTRSIFTQKDDARYHTSLLCSNTLQEDDKPQQYRMIFEPRTVSQTENPTRRTLFLNTILSITVFATTPPCLATTTPPPKSRSVGYPLQRTNQEWSTILTPAQYTILRKGGTERQRSSVLNLETRPGTFLCAGCSDLLFSSEDKFASGTGWPSFAAAVGEDAVESVGGSGIGASLSREVRCRNCGGHLGDVFDDGWRFVGTSAFKTGKRFCIDGAALVFVPEGGGKSVRGDLPPPNKVIAYEQSVYRQ